MNPTNLRNLIARGEGERLEFKSGDTPSSKVAEVICGFLNKDGGQLLIGVGDRGKIIGVENSETIANRLRSELPNQISPPALWTVESTSIDEKNILLIEVPEGQDKPYLTHGAIYFRRGSKIVPATRDDISQLIIQRSKTSQRWEEQVAVGADRTDLDDRLILETLRLAVDAKRWSGNIDDSNGFLSSLGLIDNGAVTNAAVLLYAKEPTRIFPQARARLVVMPEGKTGDRYTVDRLFDGCLLKTAQQIPEVLATLLGGVASEFTNEWQRMDRETYPMTALREGIMNALVHRDYAMSGSITISVFPKSLEISNPGALPNELKPADLKKSHQSLPRNPRIAHVCFLYGLIEKIGRGTQRIIEDFKTAHLPEPKWQSGPAGTTLILSSPLERSRAVEELNDRQQKILTALEDRKQLRPPELIRLIGKGVTERTVRNDLQALIDRGLVSRRGKGRASSYAVAGKRG